MAGKINTALLRDISFTVLHFPEKYFRSAGIFLKKDVIGFENI